jgi:uncharacterized protein (DUF1330 family)
MILKRRTLVFDEPLGGLIMRTRYTILLSMTTGAALGGAAIQGLHAQSKLKAYSIGEIEVTDASAQPGYVPPVRNAIEQAHGRSLRTLNGRVVSIEGGAPPKNVAIVEWDSLDDAVAFYKSKAWTDLAPQRDKSQKTIRRYVVEAEK